MAFDFHDVDQICIECDWYGTKCQGQNICEWIKENCKKENFSID